MPRYNPTAIYMRGPIRQALSEIWNYPLTVVEAPMGYGKTTAVKEYLSVANAKVCWQTVANDSASAFWHGFSRLFDALDARAAAVLAELGVPDNILYAQTAVQMIVELEYPQKTVLVIDDYHWLNNVNLDRFIELLVRTLPPELHIVIVSRAMFGENSAEMVRKKYCRIIDKKYFELTADEIDEYYELCGIRLKQQETAELYAYTEGWISALYLSMLNFVQAGRIEQQASLQELIEQAVYRRCPDDVKEFLLILCVFDNFSLAQAKSVWRKSGVESILHYLKAHNAFLKYDAYNKTYQMHNIFTSYLRELLWRQGRDRRHDVLRLAAKWYESVENYLGAMDCYHEIGDYDSLLTAFERDNSHSTNLEHKTKMINFFQECPVDVKRKHPVACLIFAKKMFSFNEREMYIRQCEEVSGYIDAILDEGRRKQLLGEFELIKSFEKYNDIRGMVKHQGKAYELLDGPSRLFDNRNFWTFGSPSVLYMFYRQSGKLAEEVELLQEFMPRYCQITAGHGAGGEYVMQAERYFYRGEFDDAARILPQATAAAEQHRQIVILLCVLFLQIRLTLVNGTWETVRGLLRQMRTVIEQYGQYQVIHTVDMCEGWTYASISQSEKIPAWIAAGKVQESWLHFPSHAFFNILYGRTLLADRQYLKLIGLAGPFHGVAGVFPNLLGHIYTYIYVAAAQYRLQHGQEALKSLRQAVEIAAPDQLIMPFVENGEFLGELLVELEKEAASAEFVSRIRTVYALYAQNIAMLRQEKTCGDPLACLSTRELEIAGYVANGLSNQEIAARIFIGEATVKKTLQNAFAKLGVTSRTKLARMMLEQKKV